MSIRDIVRRERWEMNRCAHEAELLLAGATNTSDLRDEADGWEMILASYQNEAIAENFRRLQEHLVR